jgi:hypothetical protein
MSTTDLIRDLLATLGSQLSTLPEEDIQKLSTGKYEITLKVSRVRASDDSKGVDEGSSAHLFRQIVDKLNAAKSRDEGISIIDESLKTKGDLSAFAKFMDVAVMKSDRVDVIKANLVDATVGARLRSSAIQGKEI